MYLLYKQQNRRTLIVTVAKRGVDKSLTTLIAPLLFFARAADVIYDFLRLLLQTNLEF